MTVSRRRQEKRDAGRVGSTPGLTVPPLDTAESTRRWALLADRLTDRGHDVALFASDGSDAEARVAPPPAAAPDAARLADEFYALGHAVEVNLDRDTLDVSHDDIAHGAAVAAATGRQPIVHALQAPRQTAPATTPAQPAPRPSGNHQGDSAGGQHQSGLRRRRPQSCRPSPPRPRSTPPGPPTSSRSFWARWRSSSCWR